MSTDSVATGRLALIIGKVLQTCREEPRVLEEILRDSKQEQGIDLVWNLAAVDAALYASFRRVFEVSAEYLDVGEEDIPPSWHPGPDVETVDQLLQSWFQIMDERVVMLGGLYEQARKITLSTEVGETDLGDLHLDIDRLLGEDYP